MKRIKCLVGLLVIIPNLLFAQSHKETNPYVSFEVDTSNNSYTFFFSFKDQFRSVREINMTFPVELTHKMILRFGIPHAMFDKYIDSPENQHKRNILLKNGLFMEKGEYLVVDKSAMVQYYAPEFCQPLAEWVVTTLQSEGIDNRKNRIEMAMSFVQDIPYAIPDKKTGNRYFGGVITPPEVLLRMYGDCDSKAILFAGILSNLIDPSDILFLNQDKHVLTAVRGEPEDGHVFVKFKGSKYLVAETAGPGKRRLGEKGKYFRNSFEVEPLLFPNKEIPEIFNPEIAEQEDQAPDGSIIIKNTSGRQFRFELSHDRNSWKKFYLDPDYYGEYNLETGAGFYLRVMDSKRKYDVFTLLPGKEYNASWDKKKRKWILYVY